MSCSAAKTAHRRDLALAVDERLDDPPGEPGRAVHLVLSADATLHAEHAREHHNEVVAGGADDEGGPVGVLVAADLVEHLGVDARQHSRQSRPGREALDVTGGHATEKLLRPGPGAGRCARRSSPAGGSGRARAPHFISWRRRTSPLPYAARAKCMPLEPAMSVRSRSKNAAPRAMRH